MTKARVEMMPLNEIGNGSRDALSMLWMRNEPSDSDTPMWWPIHPPAPGCQPFLVRPFRHIIIQIEAVFPCTFRIFPPKLK